MVCNQGGQSYVDVGLQAGQSRHFFDEACDHVRGLEQGQQGSCAWITVGINVGAKTCQRQAGWSRGNGLSQAANYAKLLRAASSTDRPWSAVAADALPAAPCAL